MIAFVNPRSARWNHRAPLSLLAVASGIEGKYDYHLLDENVDGPADAPLARLIRDGGVRTVALTVMPGPQLVRAVAISKELKRRFPQVSIIWGGTFPTIHTDTVLAAPYVDTVVSGQGESTFAELLNVQETGGALEEVRGIAFRRGGLIVKNAPRPVAHPDTLPPLPYHRIDLGRYLAKTYLGRRTMGYHSSVGCPFTCGFCSVTAVYEGRWLAKNPHSVAKELLELQQGYGIDAVEFFDDNFFVSEERTRAFSRDLVGKGISWWGDARIDTLMHFSDSTLSLMREGGCRMVYSGAESASEDTLRLMNKGGTQSPDLVLEFVRRIQTFDIIPELAFVFGAPSPDVEESIDRDIRYIRKVKEINPKAEIIFYVYAPVLLPGSLMFQEARKYGFEFPKTLEEWVSPKWQHLDLRKEPATPWLRRRHIVKIRNFERVMNACYPTVSDLKLTRAKKKFLRALGGWRYNLKFYTAPFEVRFVLSKLFKYRQPEIEGAEQYDS
jgi:anaerobic magnesium-protoporphyrin IX monomethyl ester cyclase